MPDVESFLTRKVGPLPVWGYAAAAGGLVALVYLYQKGGQPDTTAQAAQPPGAAGAPGTSPYAPSPIVITPPPTSAPAPTTPGPGTTTNAPPPSPLWQFGYGMPSDKTRWVWHLTSSGQQANPAFPAGQVYPASTSNPSTMGLQGNDSWQWSPVPTSVDASGNPWTDQTYAAALASNGMGGGGGGSSVRMIPRSQAGLPMRFSGSHAHHQFVQTAGMGGGGLHHLAQRTGVPPGRLMALNPHLRAGFGIWKDGVTRLA